MARQVLCVAEKPSISKAVAGMLSDNQMTVTGTANQYIKNYEFQERIQGQPCTVVMTALLGHLMETEFEPQWKRWQLATLQMLFEAVIVKRVRPDMNGLAANLRTEARRCQMLVIWTDCDREGENIGSEVVQEIRVAWNNLVELDMRAAAAVDARSELDLRMTLKLQSRFQEVQDQILSYGSCQFPTLGFVVDRFRKAQSFVEETFWYIEVEVEQEDSKVAFKWSRGHLFDQHLVLVLYELCMDSPTGTITKVEAKPTSKWAPLPLTTIELQKIASRSLRMSSDRVMAVAEALYNQGIISYPRTETDCFDDNFQLLPLIEKQTQDPQWGAYAQGLLNGKFTKPRKGKNNDQAHPPIHPVRGATNLQGDEKKVYDFGNATVVNMDIAGELFTARGLAITERNYLDMRHGTTSRPAMLTEAELITLMDKCGIGTDATIHEHIKKILEREYARKENNYFFPTTLGMALVTAYDEMDIDLSLSKPFLRSMTDGSQHETHL
ncbi:DNA topoisomerase [Entophlyctis helioformis]|nr:DNA topoisomerase [Entophlyctis helioformis]